MEPAPLAPVHRIRGRGPCLQRAGVGGGERLRGRAGRLEYGGGGGVCGISVACVSGRRGGAQAGRSECAVEKGDGGEGGGGGGGGGVVCRGDDGGEDGYVW